MIDINELRASIVALHGLPETDAVYTIYYDESNNVRKLRLNETGLNIGKPVCFVLAGVFHQGVRRDIDLARFRDTARIHVATDEIKFGMLAKGEFMQCMGFQKIENFLDWMREEGLLIHYQSTDVLYWSIVDIIDSILGAGDEVIVDRVLDGDMAMKNALYGVLRVDLSATTNLLHSFNYPNVGQERRLEFLDALIVRVSDNKALIDGDLGAALLKVLSCGKRLPSLPFLEGEAGGQLIESFMAFYLDRIALFNNSQHILDNETEVEQAMRTCGLHSAGQPITSYCFVNSKTNPGVQASDVVAGIMGKLFNYVIRNPVDNIKKDISSANRRQIKNLKSLRDLVDSANSVSPAFAQTIMSLEDRERAAILLD